MISIKYEAIVMIFMAYIILVTADDVPNSETECLQNIHRLFNLDVPEENSKLKELKTIDCVKKGLYYLNSNYGNGQNLNENNSKAVNFYLLLGNELDPINIMNRTTFCTGRFQPDSSLVERFGNMLKSAKLLKNDELKIRYCISDLGEFYNTQDVLKYALYETDYQALKNDVDLDSDTYSRKDTKTSYLEHIIERVRIKNNSTLTPQTYCKND